MVGVVRILVTGGAGFIGSNFCRFLLRRDDVELSVYDSLTYAASAQTLRLLREDHPGRVREVIADVCDRSRLLGAMRGHEAVVHFAAESHVDRSIADPEVFVRTNCLGTDSVLAAARQAEVAKVVHVSTDEVYGSVPEGSSKETDPLAPSSPYAATKAGSDHLALAYFVTYGLPVLVSRSSNNYGPWQNPEKVIPLFMTNLLSGRKVPLYGDGLHSRDWLFVQDNCAALELLLDRGQPGQIYNVGSGHPLPNVELTRMILELAGAGPEWVERVPDRPGHDRRYCVDSTKVRSLGWEPSWDLGEGLARTWEWYSRNRGWWEPLVGRR